jgi:biopolymer transport protein ExbD
MPLLKKKQRGNPEIPLASMSDISFLLLIFFLVTTTIDVDTGIGMTLPPKLEENQEPPPVRERNMLKILVNAQGQVLLEDRPSAVALIRAEVQKHVQNNGQDPNYAESADKAVVSFKTDRQTPYDIYVQVLDEIWMAYFEMWDAEAKQMGYPSYEAYKSSLEDEEDATNVIREKIKAQISIAEPDKGTGTGG